MSKQTLNKKLCPGWLPPLILLASIGLPDSATAHPDQRVVFRSELPPEIQGQRDPFKGPWHSAPPSRQHYLMHHADNGEMSPDRREKIRQRREDYKNLPPEERERIRKAREKYKNMSPEEKRALKEKWKKMSPKEREKYHPKKKNHKQGKNKDKNHDRYKD